MTPFHRVVRALRMTTEVRYQNGETWTATPLGGGLYRVTCSSSKPDAYEPQCLVKVTDGKAEIVSAPALSTRAEARARVAAKRAKRREDKGR